MNIFLNRSFLSNKVRGAVDNLLLRGSSYSFPGGDVTTAAASLWLDRSDGVNYGAICTDESYFYIGSWTGTVTKINADTKADLGTVKSGLGDIRGMAVADGTFYVLTADSVIKSYDSDWNLIETLIDLPNTGAGLSYYDGQLWALTYDGGLTGYVTVVNVDTADSAVLENLPTIYWPNGIIVFDDYVVIRNGDYYDISYGKSTGTKIWEYRSTASNTPSGFCYRQTDNAYYYVRQQSGDIHRYVIT